MAIKYSFLASQSIVGQQHDFSGDQPLQKLHCLCNGPEEKGRLVKTCLSYVSCIEINLIVLLLY